MKKKLLSVVLSVMMVLSIFSGISVSAETLSEDVLLQIAEDYVPGEVTGNLLRDANGDLVTGFASNGAAAFGSHTDDTYGGGEVFSVGYAGAVNFSDTDTKIPGALGMGIPKTDGIAAAYTAGDTLIFACNFAATNGTPTNVNFGLYQESYPSVMSLEYPSHNGGLRATGYCKYQDFSATVVLPEARNAIGNTAFAFGYANNDAGAKSLWIKKDSLYLGAEYAHSIDVTASATDIMAGETITVDANVYNQINKLGTLSQEVA